MAVCLAARADLEFMGSFAGCCVAGARLGRLLVGSDGWRGVGKEQVMV
jgi:hypothetical protein